MQCCTHPKLTQYFAGSMPIAVYPGRPELTFESANKGGKIKFTLGTFNLAE